MMQQNPQVFIMAPEYSPIKQHLQNFRSASNENKNTNLMKFLDDNQKDRKKMIGKRCYENIGKSGVSVDSPEHFQMSKTIVVGKIKVNFSKMKMQSQNINFQTNKNYFTINHENQQRLNNKQKQTFQSEHRKFSKSQSKQFNIKKSLGNTFLDENHRTSWGPLMGFERNSQGRKLNNQTVSKKIQSISKMAFSSKTKFDSTQRSNSSSFGKSSRMFTTKCQIRQSRNDLAEQQLLKQYQSLNLLRNQQKMIQKIKPAFVSWQSHELSDTKKDFRSTSSTLKPDLNDLKNSFQPIPTKSRAKFDEWDRKFQQQVHRKFRTYTNLPMKNVTIETDDEMVKNIEQNSMRKLPESSSCVRKSHHYLKLKRN